MIIKPRCRTCNKQIEIVSQVKIGQKHIVKLACGHTYINTDLRSPEEKALDEFQSYDGRKLFPFQRVGVKFAIDSNARCIITDEMGLGKTPQSLAAMKMMNLIPALIVCKARLREQWAHECYRWCGEEFSLVRVIREPKFDKPWPDEFGITIVSFDSLPTCKWAEDEKLLSKFKLLIIDETQQIKNLDAKRTQALQKVSKYIPHVIGCSGTPIKNNAAEYFSILNIVRPDIFNNFNQFTYEYVDSYDNGWNVKYGGLNRNARTKFQEVTKDFIIRRTMDEVLPDLPKIQRTYSYHELGEKVERAYNQALEDFMEAYTNGNTKDMFGTGILAYMARMRYLTGVAKIDPVVDYVEEFLLSTERKIAIATHHDDVADLLFKKLSATCKDGAYAPPINLANVKAEDTTAQIEKFRESGNRILILKTLMHGEGLNIQFCSDAVVMEREWNPANEEQVETRFRRIGSVADSIRIKYPVAVGTIDEFLASLVEEKRSYMAATLDGKDYKWDESSLMKELAEKLFREGAKTWKPKKK